jgi:Beta-lactamase enzyme family
VRRVLPIVLALLLVPASAHAQWRPHVGEAAAFAKERRGTLAFAVHTPTRTYGWNARRTFPSASVLKAMLMVAYLNQPSVRDRPLRRAERRLVGPMITRSDNAAATTVLQRVGAGRLRALARRAGMRRFTPVTGIWGHSRINAEDQARFFLRIDRLTAPRHRAYAMRLLRSIVPRQRWGIARVTPPGWLLHFKGGWGSGTGRVGHQVALLTRGEERVSVAILTQYQGTHAYMRKSLRGIARRLLTGL